MISLPWPSMTATEIVAWRTSMPIYFFLFHHSRSLLVGVIRIITTYCKVGAFLCCVKMAMFQQLTYCQ